MHPRPRYTQLNNQRRECLQAEKADHSGAKNEALIAVGNSGEGKLHAPRRQRLQHGGFPKRELIRQAINDSLWNDDVFGESFRRSDNPCRKRPGPAGGRKRLISRARNTDSSARNRGIKGTAIAFGQRLLGAEAGD